MRFKVIPGKNYKKFVRICDLNTAEDFNHYEIVKNALYRREYKPFIKSANKTISVSYLFQEYLFPAQFWQDVKEQLYELTDIEYELEDEWLLYDNDITREQFDEFISKLNLPSDISVDTDKYRYQQDSVYLALKNKIGHIEIGTSGGKTFITYLYCRYLFEHICLKSNDDLLEGQKILIIVPSKLLVNQLSDDFKHYQANESRKLRIESIYAGAKKLYGAEIVCATFQSLSNYEEEYFDDFGYVICDELHRSKAYSIRNEIYAKIKRAEYFFGMTGTIPKKTSIDYLHMVSMFGPLLFKKTIRSLIDDGISTPIKMDIIQLDYSRELIDEFKTGCKLAVANDENRYIFEKNWFQQLDARTNLIYKLLNVYNQNALILVDTVEYCSILKTALASKFGDTRQIEIIHGNVKNREDIVEDMRQSENGFILIGTYGTMSTGISIKSLEQIYLVDGGKSDVRIRQSLGRGIRLHPNKDYCQVFDFYDNMPGSAFSRHAKERMKIYTEQKLNFNVTKTNLT